MPISAPIRVLAAAAFLVPVVGACAPDQHATSQPGTTPSVWTGSPAPSAEAGHGPETTAAAEPGEKLAATLKLADGTEVATAEFVFTGGVATVTVETTTAGKLTPGFHGLHIHSVGKCEGDFTSAGAHLQVPGHTGHPSSGDLSSLQVLADGTGKLVTTTDAFTAEQLLAGTRTAIVIHEQADNFANIPADRYQQINGTPGPDETTMATGDAGKRVACGVIAAE